MTPLVIGLMFAAQLACDLPPWPVGNYELTLLVWTVLWLAFLGYSLCCGSYVETYLFNPQQRRLWHLNSGEVLDLKALAELARARQKPADAAATDASPQERLLPMAAERLLGINWQRLQSFSPTDPAHCAPTCAASGPWTPGGSRGNGGHLPAGHPADRWLARRPAPCCNGAGCRLAGQRPGRFLPAASGTEAGRGPAARAFNRGCSAEQSVSCPG